jgi:hypothetical protein
MDGISSLADRPGPSEARTANRSETGGEITCDTIGSEARSKTLKVAGTRCNPCDPVVSASRGPRDAVGSLADKDTDAILVAAACMHRQPTIF